jgi:hypothetical protein
MEVLSWAMLRTVLANQAADGLSRGGPADRPFLQLLQICAQRVEYLACQVARQAADNLPLQDTFLGNALDVGARVLIVARRTTTAICPR